MTVILYNITDAVNVVPKRLGTGREVTAELKGSVSLLNPSLILNYAGVDFNYMYIPEFSRYYWTGSPSVLPGERISVTGKIDPLQSHNAALGNRTVTVIRSEQWEDTQLVDTKRPVHKHSDTVMKDFDKPVVISSGSDMKYVIGVI